MESKSLNIRSYPKIVQEFAEENFNLKALCGTLLGLLFILLVLVVYLVKRGPEVIALDGNGQMAKQEMKITDVQIQSAAEVYISYRYKWTPENINDQLKKAEYFIDPSLVGSFQKSMIEVQKFVREKKVRQKLYPNDIKVNLKEKKITILADRITEFDNLNAATKMRVVLDFVIGDRTLLNPWGVYIKKETEGEAN
jgi:uncharacterized membrane protein